MTHFTLHSDAVHNSGLGFFGRLQLRFAQLAETLVEGYNARRTAAELNSLSDRSLQDIGISRTDIDRIARFGR
jgi:uncharacterized protein YjiS (DUF1127 family)